MTARLTSLQSFGIVVFILLITVACSFLVSEQTVYPTQTRSEVPTSRFPTPTSVATFTPFPALQTHTPLVTPLVNNPLIHAWQTEYALATPIRNPVVPGMQDQLPRVYTKDGSLYYQNSPGQTVRLTNSGKDRDPILSEDGRKIVFFRGEAADNIHSLNSDGSREQAIVTGETPLLIGKGDIRSPSFVPRTHILVFNTYDCSPSKGLYDYPDCVIGIYSIDTDTGAINKVIENISGNSMRTGNFEISPDGKYISVAGAGHINVYAFSSGRFKIAYPDVVTYSVTPSDEYLPKQYWLPDSSGLIIITAADHEYNEPATPPWFYVAFRYTVNDPRAVRLSLESFITWDNQHDDWCVSPDRNWILFTGNQTGDRRDDSFHYLGNLIDGHTQAFQPAGWPLFFCKWSSDSRHFAFTNTIGFIGSVDGPPVPVGGHFEAWIDATHYYYGVTDDATGATRTYIGVIDGK
jgi:hypothetical protein